MACLVQLNLYLMAFNLCLPAYPLDGGRILADALLLCRVPVRIAAYVTAALAVAIAAGLIAWGLIQQTFITALVGGGICVCCVAIGRPRPALFGSGCMAVRAAGRQLDALHERGTVR